MNRIRFVTKSANAVRTHYLTAEDARVLLSRLPLELWSRLRQVHFNDRAWGNRRLGYVMREHHDITICALPHNVSFERCFRKGPFSPAHFGGPSNGAWPVLAVRRFLLYDVFLHELGHLQVVVPNAKRESRRFAREKLAQEFADGWREKLWSTWFDHPDPIHNRPTIEEISALFDEQTA